MPVFTSSWITGPALAPPFPLLVAIEDTVLFIVSNDNPIVTAINMSGAGLDIPIIFTTIPVSLIGLLSMLYGKNN